jgi:hypothetical protein
VLGRRRHKRFSISNSNGTLSVLREITLKDGPNAEVIAVDREPRSKGEVVTVETVVNNAVTVRHMVVVSSSPIVRSGAVLHQMLLRPINENTSGKDTQ